MGAITLCYVEIYYALVETWTGFMVHTILGSHFVGQEMSLLTRDPFSHSTFLPPVSILCNIHNTDLRYFPVLNSLLLYIQNYTA